jgi:hypothetical protein
MFHEQSRLWGNISKQHVKKVSLTVFDFVNQVLVHFVKETHVRKWILSYTYEHLKSAELDAMNELDKLLEDERRQPITYNHYYTDNIQKAEHDSIRKDIQQATQILREAKQKTPKTPSITEADIHTLVASLQTRIVVNMDEASCDRALCSLDAYYKVRYIPIVAYMISAFRTLTHILGRHENVCR